MIKRKYIHILLGIVWRAKQCLLFLFVVLCLLSASRSWATDISYGEQTRSRQAELSLPTSQLTDHFSPRKAQMTLQLVEDYYYLGQWYQAKTECLRLNHYARRHHKQHWQWYSSIWLNRLLIIEGDKRSAMMLYLNQQSKIEKDFGSTSGSIPQAVNAMPISANQPWSQNISEQWRYDYSYILLEHNLFAAASQQLEQIHLRCKNNPSQPKSLAEVPPITGQNYLSCQQLNLVKSQVQQLQFYQSYEWPRLRHESWHSAVFSAIIPGLGQMYNGQADRGLLSFATVSGFAGMATFSYQRGQQLTAGIFLYLAVVFYSHGIYRSLESAEHFNAALLDAKKQQVLLSYRQNVDWLAVGENR